MPSKKQRAKKPGSKVAREKVAEEGRRGFVWARHEDDAAQWFQQQLRKECDSVIQGAMPIPSPGVSRDDNRAKPKKIGLERTNTDESSGGELRQYAVTGMIDVAKDEMHDATNGEMKVHTPGSEYDARDEMNKYKAPITHKDEAKLVKGKVTDLGTMAMRGLLQEHGLQTVPDEWNTDKGRLLLKEVLQVRVNKLKKAKQQRDKRRENRKQQ